MTAGATTTGGSLAATSAVLSSLTPATRRQHRGGVGVEVGRLGLDPQRQARPPIPECKCRPSRNLTCCTSRHLPTRPPRPGPLPLPPADPAPTFSEVELRVVAQHLDGLAVIRVRRVLLALKAADVPRALELPANGGPGRGGGVEGRRRWRGRGDGRRAALGVGSRQLRPTSGEPRPRGARAAGAHLSHSTATHLEQALFQETPLYCDVTLPLPPGLDLRQGWGGRAGNVVHVRVTTSPPPP
jgi:hypothetical protein